MNASYPPPFSTTMSASATVSWSCAEASYECGSCVPDVTIEVTSTNSPPISCAIWPYTFVEVTTMIGSATVGSAAGVAAEASPEAQPASARTDTAPSAAGTRRRRVGIPR